MPRRLFTATCALSLLLCVGSAALWVQSYRLTPRKLGTVTRVVRSPDMEMTTSMPGVPDLPPGERSRYPFELRFRYRGRSLSACALGGRFRIDNWPEMEEWTHRMEAVWAQWQARIDADPRLRRNPDDPDDARYGLDRAWEAVWLLDDPKQPPKAQPTPQPTLVEHSIPCAIPTALLAIMPGWWMVLYARRLLRAIHGRCIACGYDLRATPDRCPECGLPNPTSPAKAALLSGAVRVAAGERRPANPQPSAR